MDVIRRGEEGFETARVGPVFNERRPARQPAAVALPESDDDVVAAIQLARLESLQVSVRAGGHSWAAWSVRDDALLIDLRRMRSMSFDADTGVAVVNPGIRGGEELVPYLDAHGRVFPGGHCASVGLGGYLLQGGQGWNSRKVGWGCENVVAIDVVTADGRLLRADESQNSELLWAARGAGPGFFGVVTRFHLRTQRKPSHMTEDTWTFPLDELEPLLEWMHELLPELEPVVEPVIAATRLLDVPLDPGAVRPEGPVLLLHTTAMCESAEEVERVFAPFDSCPLAAKALGHVRGSTNLAEQNEAQTTQNPVNHRYAADCTWTDAGAAELAPLLRAMWSELPTEHSFSIWYGWAPTRELPDMAFSLEANVYLATYAIWRDAADDERHRSWVHERIGAIADRYGEGVYLGDTDFTRRPDKFMADANFARLQELRAEWDPDGRFCSYLIDPSAELNKR